MELLRAGAVKPVLPVRCFLYSGEKLVLMKFHQGVLGFFLFLCQCYWRGMSCGARAALGSWEDAHQQHLFQVLLCNPICVVGYALASWRFFRERIEEEEITLIHFFGEEYLEYKRKVPSGLPFIKGVKLEL